jgi:hypothetical protein
MNERNLTDRWAELSDQPLEGLAALDEGTLKALTISIINSGVKVETLRNLRQDLYIESISLSTLKIGNGAESAFGILSLAIQALIWADSDPVGHFAEFEIRESLLDKWVINGDGSFDDFTDMVTESTLTEYEGKMVQLLHCPCCGKSGVDVLFLFFLGMTVLGVDDSAELGINDISHMFSILGHEALTDRQFLQLPALLVEQLQICAGRSITLSELIDVDLRRDVRLFNRRENLTFSEGLFLFVEEVNRMAIGVDIAFRELDLSAQEVVDISLCFLANTNEYNMERYEKFCSDFGYSHGLRAYALYASEVQALRRKESLKITSKIPTTLEIPDAVISERSWIVSDSCPGCGGKTASSGRGGRVSCVSCGLGIVHRSCILCSAPAVVQDTWGKFECRCGKMNASTPVASLNELGRNAFWSTGGLTFAAGVYLEAKESYLDTFVAVIKVITSVSFFDYAFNGLLTGLIAAGTTIATGKALGYRWE